MGGFPPVRIPTSLGIFRDLLGVYTHFELLGLDKWGKISPYKKENIYSKSKLQRSWLYFFVFLRSNEYSVAGTLSA